LRPQIGKQNANKENLTFRNNGTGLERIIQIDTTPPPPPPPGNSNPFPGGGGVWIFSGTTHYNPKILTLSKEILFFKLTPRLEAKF